MAKLKRRTKSCKGCGDHFITLKNYDYCVDCAVNNNRYATKSPCSECDGSRWIKFKGHPKRPRKLCYLTKPSMKKIIEKNVKNTQPYETNLSYWKKVNQQAHYRIADLLNKVLPLPNLRDKKNLDLDKDADYRSLLVSCQEEYGDSLPASEQVAEEIIYEYLWLVSKSLLENLSNSIWHRTKYFEGLFQKLCQIQN